MELKDLSPFFQYLSRKSVPHNTPAAGDTFIGAFAGRYVAGSPLPEATRYATAAAAISVSRLGAQTSIPIVAEVEEFLSSH